ncbi:MAG: hypothetical protein EPO41_03795 [Reyranella sp.]|uniref:hypothetical protein n=1 Tax=Reyranella sp. TaxID=1929291 RepID=UPI0012190369|nr:hypothetical protein [Reyranella sp.]TAJ97124.1 MAG: hypothetical protein EPO41_03795 [Reyranella sp.]
MAEKKPKPQKFTSEIGTAFHPYLDKPDTKFKDEGEFKVNMRWSAEDAAKIKAQVDEKMKEARKLPDLLAAKKKNPKAAIPENTPYKEAIDDNGDETGELEFKFATTASGKSKKDGKPWKRTIKFFDAKGQPMKPISLWSGSRLRVSYTIGTYFINAKVGYGVKLYLEAVKVIEAVQGSGGSAKDYGFGEEEEGYTKDDMQSNDSDDAGDDSSDSEDNDGDDATDF